MPRLPAPRGALTDVLFERLLEAPGTLGDLPEPEGGPLDGEDFHLALYVLYELHYRGFDEVDERWEWDPSLLALRAGLEAGFEDALRAAVPTDEPPGADVPAQLAALLAAEPDAGLSRFLEHQATLDQFREFVIHRSAYQLKENDPHAFALPRLDGRTKVAMAEIQADEYGGGRAERLHATLFGDLMEEIGLDRTYGAYLDAIGAVTLATVNLMSLFALHRRLRGAIVGHLAVLEMDSSIPNRRYGNGLRRLGFGKPATEFYDEHVEADAVHEAIAAHDLAGALAVDDPPTREQILFGARALLMLEARMADHLLGAWDAGVSSLRQAQLARTP